MYLCVKQLWPGVAVGTCWLLGGMQWVLDWLGLQAVEIALPGLGLWGEEWQEGGQGDQSHQNQGAAWQLW